jgi:hypothetical protein
VDVPGVTLPPEQAETTAVARTSVSARAENFNIREVALKVSHVVG